VKKSKIIITSIVILSLICAGVYLHSRPSEKSIKGIRVNVGDDFIIMLKSNRTTGYEWQIDKPLDGNAIGQEGLKYVPSDTGLVGSGGIEEWKFIAKKSGRSKIFFKYVRPWEKGVPPVEKKVFEIDIRK
jgi:inhibitor of cysteine peptidase